MKFRTSYPAQTTNALLLFMIVVLWVQPFHPALAKSNLSQNRMNKDVTEGKPLVAHLIVALCDNKYQGIVKVPKSLGNGQNPRSNLYWGALYGVKTYLAKKKAWKLVSTPKVPNKKVLERIVLHKSLIRNGIKTNAYIVADAYDGQYIKTATIQLFKMAQGLETESLGVTISGKNVTVDCGGNSHLIGYVGHNGLMDFSVSYPRSNQRKKKPASAMVLACASKQYFLNDLKQIDIYPLILTTNFMAPEAYTVETVIRNWFEGKSPKTVRDQAAKVYNKFHKCGIRGATRLFYFEK